MKTDTTPDTTPETTHNDGFSITALHNALVTFGSLVDHKTTPDYATRRETVERIHNLLHNALQSNGYKDANGAPVDMLSFCNTLDYVAYTIERETSVLDK